MGILRKLWSTYGPNPLDLLLKRAEQQGKTRFLLCWNRGLGDIPLGMYALVHRIRAFVPEAEITFITRSDLAEGFQMLSGVRTYVASAWKRKVPIDLESTLGSLNLSRSDFDVILEEPNPTQWLRWQLGKLVPKLAWNSAWDPLSLQFFKEPSQRYIGVHVQTETSYTQEKNWPVTSWQSLFEHLQQEVILFGFAKAPVFAGEGIIDLRGKTSLPEMLSIIKNCCSHLVVPDSGVLSLTYYLDVDFPVRIVSLWADPKQGVLKQNVPSPNPSLHHLPLIAAQGDLRSISVERVVHALGGVGC